MMLNKVGV